MNKENRHLQLLALGFDAYLTEKFKKIIKTNKMKARVAFSPDAFALSDTVKRRTDAILFYSQGQFGQTLKLIQKLIFSFPKASIILISPKNDSYQLVSYFRVGVSDALLYPLDDAEIVQVLDRLLPKSLMLRAGEGNWDPLKAVLHFFSQRQLFEHWQDVEQGLKNYLTLYFKLTRFAVHDDLESMRHLGERKKWNEKSRRKWQRFLKQPDHFFEVPGEQSSFIVIKLFDKKWVIAEGKKHAEWEHTDIFSDYFFHLLKASVDHCLQLEQQKEMMILSHTDEVTGLYNQRKLLQDIDYQITNYESHQNAFSLLFVDIDFFKMVNDQFGHVIGSQILNDMSQVLKQELRGSDLVYRYGGDEFIVLLPKTHIEEAKKIAQRLASAVKGKEFKIDTHQYYRMSLSIGIAEYPTDAQDAKHIIEFADKMMYLSKKSGRGKIFHVNEVA